MSWFSTLVDPAPRRDARPHGVRLPWIGIATLARMRWLQATLWSLGVISFVIATTRALDIGISTYQVDFDVYLMGAKHVFTGHLYTSYLASPREPFTYPPISALLFVPFTAVPAPLPKPYGQLCPLFC